MGSLLFLLSQHFLINKKTLANSFSYNNMQLKETGFFDVLTTTLAEEMPVFAEFVLILF